MGQNGDGEYTEETKIYSTPEEHNAVISPASGSAELQEFGANEVYDKVITLEKGENYLASHLHTQGGDSVLSIPLGKGNSPFYEKEVEPLAVHMSGQETFKFAVKQISADLKLIAEQAGIEVTDFDWIVPHQANYRIIELAARRLGIPIGKFVLNLDRYGNTSSASVPISFDELARSGKLKKGDLIAMCAFGGGLSSAACLIRW